MNGLARSPEVIGVIAVSITAIVASAPAMFINENTSAVSNKLLCAAVTARRAMAFHVIWAFSIQKSAAAV